MVMFFVPLVGRLPKGFDSVWRAGLWQVMRHIGYDEKIINIPESFYKDTMSAVRVDWFTRVIGVLLYKDVFSLHCCLTYC